MTETLDRPTHSAPNTAPVIVPIPVDAITPSVLNPRKHFDAAELEELAASIREHGLLQPIVVRPNAAAAGHYWIIAGERRWRAAQLAGLAEIAATVRADLDDAAHLRLAIIENVQRRDLDPIEEAEGYAQLNRIVGMKQVEIAAAVNRSQPAIANTMRLLELPEDVRELIRTRKLSVAHGVALARYKDFPDLVSRLAAVALERSWPSAKLEEKDLLYGWDVMHAGVVRSIRRGTLHPFDQSVCLACPFDAYRAADEFHGICLKVEHYDQLKTDAEAAREAAAQARLAQALPPATAVVEGEAAAAPALPKLSELRYQTYEHIPRYESPPAGCTAECPCRGAALGHDGKPVAICTDPRRYRKLAAAQTRARNKAANDARKAAAARIAEALGTAALGTRELALIAAAAFPRSGCNKPVMAGAAALCPGLDATGLARKLGGWELDSGKLDTLAALDRATLTRLVVHALLTEELENAKGRGAQELPKAVLWYLGETPVTVVAPAPRERE